MMKIGLHHCVVTIIICEKNGSHDIKNYSSMLIIAYMCDIGAFAGKCIVSGGCK